MTTIQTNVTKQSQINYFTTNLRNLIANATLWHIGAENAQILVDCKNNLTGFPTEALGGGQDPGGPTLVDLSEAAVTASIIVNSFQAWARQYTRVRNFRFRRTGNIIGANTVVDVTRVTHFANSFTARIASYNTTTVSFNTLQTDAYTDINNTAVENGIFQGANIRSTNFNAFVNQLYNKWNVYKNNTITLTYDYCHSNCHSSCHSSTRWRR